MSKENFKLFARNHPELVGFIKNGDMTWQKFYEIYDIYGEDAKSWSSYINTAQKAIGVVQELAGKKGSEVASNLVKGPINPRPINKFFED